MFRVKHKIGNPYAKNLINMKLLPQLLKLIIYVGLLILTVTSCCGKSTNINAINHPSFNAKGEYIDTLEHLTIMPPTSLKFFVEASGSMNGFFRSNQPTDFKADIWSIFSNFEQNSDKIYVFEQPNKSPTALDLQTFKLRMNSGKFISSASTEVPKMIQQILQDTDIEHGEAAVLVSDMKYSPVGNEAMNVLLSQYATDIRNIMSKSNASIILIGTTSNFIDNRGKIICNESPYYFLIMGNSNHAAWLRNNISTLLKDNGKYMDAIEFGMNYKSPSFKLKALNNGIVKSQQPTICGFDKKYNDTCRFKMTINLSAYPWKLIDNGLLKDSIILKTTEHSSIKVDSIIYRIDNHSDKILNRIAEADLYIKIFNMYSKADVLEWKIKVPEIELDTLFTRFFGAKSEMQLDKSFSIESFILGCFRGKSNNYAEKPNRILISTLTEY